MGKVCDALAIGGGLAVAPFIWWSWTADPLEANEPAMTASQELEAGARLACREFISDQLRDPGSAEWGMSSGNYYASWPARAGDEGRVHVQPAFRANNGFGAKTFSQWNCEVQKRESSWSLVNLSEV